MNQPDDFFPEFPPVSKAEWQERIVKDLKGKPLADLYWHLNAEITVDPFGHADDFAAPPLPLQAVPGGWEIGEDVDATDPVESNRQALDALTAGAESLYFDCPAVPSSTDLKQQLREIHLDYISLHFGGMGVREAPAALLSAVRQIGLNQGIAPERLRGALAYSPASKPDRELQDWRYLADLLAYAQAEMPGFRCIDVPGFNVFQGPEGASDELAAVLTRGRLYLEKLTDRGLSADAVAAQMQVSLYVGKSYFVEIAKLRALKLLWANLLQAFGATPTYPALNVRFFPGDYSDELYTNMIRATTMAMSAVLGGANRLTVLPYDAGREAQATYPRAFARRIARNVQHLLKLESGLGDIVDPAAGSYYIEKLTAQLAAAAWKKFGQS